MIQEPGLHFLPDTTGSAAEEPRCRLTAATAIFFRSTCVTHCGGFFPETVPAGIESRLQTMARSSASARISCVILTPFGAASPRGLNQQVSIP